MPIIKFDREFRWLPVIIGAVVGLAIMFILLGPILRSVVSPEASNAEFFGVLVGLLAAIFLITGFIAGVLTHLRGPTYGLNAALIVAIVSIIYSFVSDFYVEQPTIPVAIVAVFIWIIFSIGFGALGGFIGGLIRR